MLDVCYWEGILSMMNNANSITGELKKPVEDAYIQTINGSKIMLKKMNIHKLFNHS